MDDTTKTGVATSNKGKEIQKSAPMRVMNPFEEMDEMFDNFLQRGWMSPFQMNRPMLRSFDRAFEGKVPSVDIIEHDGDILVRAEVPGVDKKDLDISVTENTVTIKGKSSHEEKEEKGDYYRCEISRGAFARTVSLPHDVDPDNAKASFKDGLLEMTIPKLKKSKRHSVNID
ncbi:Hsp20/alpha crystallin family protein [Sulfurirhabdus autotrophica]|uniref:Heat shock protein Hsp20 n=1 Tax=Sulfurirhabdus autotrophica TaxID=1706046 RepID=A0A4R3YE23_9PROT|nr:Hsp20/alpha crystallin family protein [Sulfurirhabdus autotrophica]TCV90397.1 heat shock protein Hsp20 [Sulfurirhabdus autotrophica]